MYALLKVMPRHREQPVIQGHGLFTALSQRKFTFVCLAQISIWKQELGVSLSVEIERPEQ